MELSATRPNPSSGSAPDAAFPSTRRLLLPHSIHPRLDSAPTTVANSRITTEHHENDNDFHHGEEEEKEDMLRPASSHDAMSTGARRDVQADGMRNIYASHNAVTALTSSRADMYPRRSNEMIFSAAPVLTTAEQERTMQMVAKQWSGATEENHDLQNRPLDGQVRSSGHDGRFKRARDLLPSDDEPAKRARYNSNALRSPSPGIYTSFPYGLPRPEEASHHDHGHGQPSEAMSEATAVPDPGDFDKTAGVPRAAAHHPHQQGHTHLRVRREPLPGHGGQPSL
ncbi:uncharacterized protein L3040_008674 [Drepanopeziza brunnea f. sp. 'multigermtubi']|uniref:uncharacterized protein n=1 Tax=Drepanopeziza brunnea f. sp. 'multigermtubi' TaxID=698441 RepID=UPI0023839120|nr:hypothetical protein L3040_008674 [Drepanopeziza brunnea f. sp. 'multigermtubi']